MAAKVGAAAAPCYPQERTAYSRVEPNGYTFVPLSEESYGRMGQPRMQVLHFLGEEAERPVGVERAPFVVGAVRELSIGQGWLLMYAHAWGCLLSQVGQH
jgi:hypothetical protein